jgi:D-amino-acid dehydrogenase
LYELSSLSRTHLQEFLQSLPAAARNETGFAANGKLVLYHNPAKMRSARAQLALMNGLGANQSLLTRDQCIEQEPALARAQTGFVGGVLTPGEEVVDGFSLCRALVRQCQQTGRCHFVWSADVLRFELANPDSKTKRRINAVTYQTQAGQRQQLGADSFVIANGHAAAVLGQQWAMDLPVQPMRGFSIHLPQDCVGAMPKLSITESSLHTVFAPLNLPSGIGLRVAGMAEMVGAQLTIESAKIVTLKESMRKVFGLHNQAVAQADIKPWVGLRPVTPSALPIIGRAAKVDNCFVNVGQGALGLTLAFGSAQLLVDCVQQRESAIDRRAYLPTT